MRRNKTKKAKITKVAKKKKRSWNAREKLAIVTYFEKSIERSPMVSKRNIAERFNITTKQLNSEFIYINEDNESDSKSVVDLTQNNNSDDNGTNNNNYSNEDNGDENDNDDDDSGSDDDNGSNDNNCSDNDG
ncbi:1348_t:CDS:2, partial [Gigaspora margarita]